MIDLLVSDQMLGTVTTPRKMFFMKEDISGIYMYDCTVRWNVHAYVRVASKVPMSKLFGSRYVLLRGEHITAKPFSGIVHATLAEILDNPSGLSYQDLFNLLYVQT